MIPALRRPGKPCYHVEMPSLRSLKSRFPGSPAARWGKMFGLSAVIGVLTGLAASGLRYGLDFGIEHLIGRFADLGGPGVWQFSWGVLLLPTVGGLLSGLLVHYFAGRDDKHGTNQVIDAFHYRGGNLDLPGPAVKAAAAVGVISFGGSAGPEAPIAALGSAIGSKVARLLALTPHERRVMLIAGCAGGVGAVFQCPLGGALFATSVMYREPEFDGDSIVPAFVSSVLSYSTFITVMKGVGRHMLGGAGELVFAQPLELVAYALLGPLCGLFSILFYYCFRLVETRPLGRLGLPGWIAPALGGLAVGAVGCVLPQVMAGQYQFIQNAMDGTLLQMPEGVENSWWQWAALFGAVAVLKCLATALTVGSGASGGALGPSVFIGGAVGALLGAVIHAVAPDAFADVETLRRSLIPVGMAGVLAASMRTPMAAIVMVTEMTGSYGLIVPLMLVCVTAYVVGRRWGLNSAQVRSASESPAHAADLLVHTLQALRVRDVMVGNWPYRVAPSAILGELVAGARSGSRPVFAVVDREKLVGIVSLADISRVMAEPGISSLVIAADIMTPQFTSVDPDLDLYQALELFNNVGHEVLPVVAEADGSTFEGMLPRRAIHDTIRSRTSELRGHLQREHAGLIAVEQDEQLYQLMLGVSAERPQSIQRMAVPYEVVGKSIRESNFAQEYNAQVIGVLHADGRLQCPPDIDAPLQADQFLVVIMATQ